MTTSALTVRAATTADAHTLSLLAHLDEDAPLRGRVLLAEDAQRPLAALSLDDGRHVADPFAPSAGAVALLQLRARQLDRGSPPRTWRLLLRRPSHRRVPGAVA